MTLSMLCLSFLLYNLIFTIELLAHILVIIMTAIKLLDHYSRLAMVVHICNPNYFGGRDKRTAVQDQPSCSGVCLSSQLRRRHR
jgi:hypothetical protein